MSVETENVRKDIRMRVETDSMMSTAWILVYIVPIVVSVVWVIVFMVALFSTFAAFPTTLPPQGELVTTTQFVPLLASIAFLYLVVIVAFIVNLVLTYKLVKRRNTHFKRQIYLLEDVVAAAKAIAAKKGADVEVGLASCERTAREARVEENEKSAVLWAVLSGVIFIAYWYVWYFLMKDFYKHERREDGFWEDLSRLLDKCGIEFSVPRRIEPLPERSFILYLILQIITLGFFGIYWLYVLLKDPNQHFKYHIQIEDQLLTSLETAVI